MANTSAIHAVGYFANGELNIKLTEPLQQNTTVIVYNALGQNVLQANLEEGSRQFAIDASTLHNNTMYLLDIQGVTNVVKVITVH